MDNALNDVCLASLPCEHLPLLAAIRCLPGVQVLCREDRAWVRWNAVDAQVLRVLLPVPGVRLFVQKKDGWYVAGSELPAFDVPKTLDGRPLSNVLLPAPVQTVTPAGAELQPVSLRLVPDHQPREARACLCTAMELQQWADKVSAFRLADVEAVCCAGRILLVGKKLPLFRAGTRFWGTRILVPLGFRPEPLVPEQTLADAAGLGEQELLLWHAEVAEVVSRSAFRPLTRAGVRLLAFQSVERSLSESDA